MHDSSRPSDGKWCASITTSSRFAKRCCEAATPGTAMSRLGLPLVTSAAILAVALASLVSAQEPKEVSLLSAPALSRCKTARHADDYLSMACYISLTRKLDLFTSSTRDLLGRLH